MNGFWKRLRESNTFKTALAQVLAAALGYVSGTINWEAFLGAIAFAVIQFLQREFKLRKEDIE